MNGKKKKTILDITLDKELQEFGKYLKKLRKKNPSKPTEYEINTASLFYAMGKTMGEIKAGVKETKENITTQTVVITLGFIGLGVLLGIGFALS